MNKNLTIVKGEIISISEPIHIPRNSKAAINKRTVGVRTIDQQVIYLEVRDTLETVLLIGQNVNASFYYAGSNKSGKTYNNLIATNIEDNEF